jgi:hypothetical protein
MKATKKQIDVIAQIETVLGIKISFVAIRRNVLKVDITDTCDHLLSKMAASIENTCNQYGIARVENCGYMAIALILK